MRYIVVKDTQETETSQLEYFSKHLRLQKDFILTTYQQSATIITEHLYRNQQIRELTSNLNTTTEKDAEILQNKLNNFTHPIFTQMKEMGVSQIGFKVTYPFEYVSEDASTLAKKPTLTFSIYKNFTGYRYEFPFIINHYKIGVIDVGFDFHMIKTQLATVNTDSEVGFIIVTNDPDSFTKKTNSVEFQQIALLPGFLIDHEFKLPQSLIDDKEACDILLRKAKSPSKDALEANDFSIFIDSDNGPLGLSMSRILTPDKGYKVYLVSIAGNHLLNKVSELNNAIFIINLIIILLGVMGISSLVINRSNIIKQKLKIQLSEKKLKEMNKSKDKFFSIIAHDLKNPFNGIMGMSGYLSSEFDEVDDKEKKEIINDINISSKNAFNLLQNLLEWTRAQSGAIKNNPVKINPKQIIDFSLETVTNLAKNKDIEIKQLHHTESSGYADENLVATVIRNLCTNAIKFSPRNSTIEIIVKEYANEMIFCVKDQGIGLHSEEIDQLFRIDVNFHKRGTEKETGSGLGLKLCKEFVNYCKGRIWVISDVGKGSSFYFTIPLYRSA